MATIANALSQTTNSKKKVIGKVIAKMSSTRIAFADETDFCQLILSNDFPKDIVEKYFAIDKTIKILNFTVRKEAKALVLCKDTSVFKSKELDDSKIVEVIEEELFEPALAKESGAGPSNREIGLATLEACANPTMIKDTLNIPSKTVRLFTFML